MLTALFPALLQTPRWRRRSRRRRSWRPQPQHHLQPSTALLPRPELPTYELMGLPAAGPPPHDTYCRPVTVACFWCCVCVAVTQTLTSHKTLTSRTHTQKAHPGGLRGNRPSRPRRAQPLALQPLYCCLVPQAGICCRLLHPAAERVCTQQGKRLLSAVDRGGGAERNAHLAEDQELGIPQICRPKS